MKKRTGLWLLTVMMLAGLTGCGSSADDSAPSEDQDTTAEETQITTEETQIYTLAADAAETSGQGVSLQGEMADTAYSQEMGVIVNFGTESAISYTVPEDVEGDFDIYLDMTKAYTSYGTTVAGIRINEGQPYIMPVAIAACAQEDYSDLLDIGTFLMEENVTLTSGDVITISGMPGYEMSYNGTMTSLMPAGIGDLKLCPVGTEMAVGYDGGEIREEEAADPQDPLSGLTIGWLGSSVTHGMYAGGYSMADAIEDAHPATECYKYTVSGTTLANNGETSYVERVKQIDPELEFDLFIVQLSTNDATQGLPMGEIAESKEMDSLDDTTIIGGMEYIIAYAEETWDCPVLFYTGTYYEDEVYQEMVDTLLKIQEKWEIGVIDLWNDPEMKEVYGTDLYQEYMGDNIHPTYKGYTEWWTPKFESYLSDNL